MSSRAVGRGDHLLHGKPPVSSAKEDAIKVRKGPVQKIGKQASDPQDHQLQASKTQLAPITSDINHVGPPDKSCS